jgi:putative ABC transport system permease protein
VVLPPAVADRLRLGYSPVEIYIRHAASQPKAHLRAANTALAQLGVNGIDIQAAYSNGIGLVLIAVVGADLLLAIAVAIAATALLLIDAAPDLRTLAAIGAAPGGRRRLALGRAGLICGLGSLLGATTGIGVGIALIWRVRHVEGGPPVPGNPIINTYPLRIPWLHLLAILVVPPIVAGATALLLRGPKLEIEARRPS